MTLYDPLYSLIQGKPPAEVITLLRDIFYGLVRKAPNVDNVYSFGYNQIRTDFKHPAARLCRGLFMEFDPKTMQWRVLCCAFHKFFNWGESLAAELDYTSLVVSDKLDGSLIKIYYYNGEWTVGTNNCPFATDAYLMRYPDRNYDQIVRETADQVGFSASTWKDRLDPQYCYIFELIHPMTQIVVNYNRQALIHLATRHVESGQEYDPALCPEPIAIVGLERPERFAYSSLTDCKKEVARRPEGFVLRDAQFNRVKLKSPHYVEDHKTWNTSCVDLVWSEKRVLEKIVDESIDDYMGAIAENNEYTTKTKTVIKQLTELDNLLVRYLAAFPTKEKFLRAYLKGFKPPANKNEFFQLMVIVYKGGGKQDSIKTIAKFFAKGEKPVAVDSKYLIPLPQPCQDDKCKCFHYRDQAEHGVDNISCCPECGHFYNCETDGACEDCNPL